MCDKDIQTTVGKAVWCNSACERGVIEGHLLHESTAVGVGRPLVDTSESTTSYSRNIGCVN